MPEHRGRRPGRRLVAAGEVGGQVGAQGHQSTAAEGMARPSRRRCRRAEPSAAGRGNLRPACAGQKLWPPMEAGRAGGRGPGGGCSPLETLAADPPPLPTGRPPRAGKAIAMGGGRFAHPVPARGAPAARPAICERAGGAAVAAVAEQRSRGEVGGGGEGGARNGGCCCNGGGRDGRRGGCLTYARWSWVYVKRPGGTSVAPTPKQQHPPSPTFRTGQTHRTVLIPERISTFDPARAGWTWWLAGGRLGALAGGRGNTGDRHTRAHRCGSHGDWAGGSAGPWLGAAQVAKYPRPTTACADPVCCGPCMWLGPRVVAPAELARPPAPTVPLHLRRQPPPRHAHLPINDDAIMMTQS